MPTLAEILAPRLQQRFPNRELQFAVPPSQFAIFPSIHGAIGDIRIYDDGDELTVVVGNFMHGHLSNYDEKLTPSQKAERIAEAVADILEDLFADRIVIWGSHQGHGGYYRLGYGGTLAGDGEKFVWSGPLGRCG